ncbi:MAG TPA: hypothetical protein VKI18_17260 [Albitalea sp.]|nr:hypothetical protein [Albitalea sp.]
MDSAEVYMALLRPSMVPVFGEASPIEFTGQIEVASWSWNIINADEKKASDAAGGNPNADPSMKKLNDDNKKLLKMEEAKFKTDAEYEAARTRFTKDLQTLTDKSYKSAKDKQAEAAKAGSGSSATGEQGGAGTGTGKGKAGDGEEAKNFEFSFSKRVDVASTQMLNSMKAGDIFPTAVLTVHQRSANSGLSLVITVQKLCLLTYSLKCEVSDTMTDMKEDWTAEFFSLAYVYKNRKAIKKASGVGQAVAQAATQGTVRAFAMKNIGSPI